MAKKAKYCASIGLQWERMEIIEPNLQGNQPNKKTKKFLYWLVLFGRLVGPSGWPAVSHAFVKNKGNQYLRANKRQIRYTRLTRCILATL